MSADDLTQRQKTLLYAVVKEYCENNESVGSSELKERYNFDFSSATIRNELMVLRERGYLYQPFKNSGSVPTEISLKLFINRLLEGLETSAKHQQGLKEKIVELQTKQSVLSKEIAKFLSEQIGGVAFTLTDGESNNIKGMGNLLKHPTQGTVSDILEFLENLDMYKQYLLPGAVPVESAQADHKHGIKMIMGGDNPVVPLGRGYGLVSTEVELESGEKSVVGLITPLAMLGQQKNLELLNALNTLLNPKQNKSE
jgi:transcriptional regulator of heat shock response